MQDATALTTLALALLAAGFGALLAVRFGQSVMLGYVAAGFIIGPNTPGFVANTALVDDLAGVGIVLLLFVVGLQVSMQHLTAVGPVTIVGGLFQIVILIALGYGAGAALGWTPIESVFLGAFVSISSTTVISKLLGDRGEMGSVHGRIALGWSAVQDVYTIALVVILTAVVEVGSEDVATHLAVSIAKATAFTGALLVIGPRVFPLVFERLALLHQRESFVLLAAAAAATASYLATRADMSPAIGAFVAGVVLNESDVWHEIEDRLASVTDLLTGLFFVSIGMLIDPGAVLGHLPAVGLAMVLIIAVKGLVSAGIIRLFGYSTGTALLAGAILAESAEFSVILARVGTEVDALGEGIADVMLAGAVLSIVLAAPLLRWVEPIAVRLQERYPGSRRTLSAEDGTATRRGHAVICGYGRVGRVIADLLASRNLPYIAIEEDFRIVQAARRRGLPVLLGNAANVRMLDRANVSQAMVLAVAIPDAFAAKEVTAIALSRNPLLSVVVRTDDEIEQTVLERLGAREAVLGERELAFEMSRYVLSQFGVETIAQQVAINRLRRRRPPAEPA